MKKVLRITRRMFFLLLTALIIFSGCTKKKKTIPTTADTSSSKIITDMGGRKVELPDKIEKVYGANPMSTILLFTLTPDKVIGWNSQMPNKEFLPEKYRNLPILGSLSSKEQAASAEDIIKYNPDIIIFAQTEINTQAINKADNISSQVGKPVILINGSLENTESTYTLLGKVLNCTDRSNTLIEYYKNTLKIIEETKSKIKDENKIKIYYGKNDNALTTSGTDSVHSKLVGMVGGINSASSVQGSADANVSIEDIMKWQPDVILLSEANNNEKGSADKVNNNDAWKGLNAVKNKKVYTSPQLIFSWFDRPPSINQLIGIKWLAETLYPSYYNIDINKEIKSFYELFYNITLTDEQINKVLK